MVRESYQASNFSLFLAPVQALIGDSPWDSNKRQQALVKGTLEPASELELFPDPSPLQENIIQVRSNVLAVQKNSFKRCFLGLPYYTLTIPWSICLETLRLALLFGAWPIYCLGIAKNRPEHSAQTLTGLRSRPGSRKQHRQDFLSKQAGQPWSWSERRETGARWCRGKKVRQLSPFLSPEHLQRKAGSNTAFWIMGLRASQVPRSGLWKNKTSKSVLGESKGLCREPNKNLQSLYVTEQLFISYLFPRRLSLETFLSCLFPLVPICVPLLLLACPSLYFFTPGSNHTLSWSC